MGARRELFVCLGTALVTTAGLFALQTWYSSYLDVALVHGQRSHAPTDARLLAVRSEERAKLAAGHLAIDQAMTELAQRGRNAFPKLAARPSEDLSAMSGWIHEPGFRPYVPRLAAAAASAAGASAAAAGAEKK